MASHVPFMTIAPTSGDAQLQDSTIPITSDSLREPSALTSKRRSSTSATDAIASTIMPAKVTRIPAWVRFPLAVILTLGLSATLSNFVPEIAGYELAAVSRSLNEPWQIGGLVGFRVFVVAIAWSMGLDYFDLFNLGILANVPYYAFLLTFLETPYLAMALEFGINLISLALPFFLLRPLNAHNAAINKPLSVNQAVAADSPIRLYMAIFAATVYSLLVYSSFYTWLPVHLVTHFDTIKTLELAHNAVLPIMIIASVPIGYAAEAFLFTASTAHPRSVSDKAFNPATATLGQTIKWNMGLKSARETVLAQRTLFLAAFTAINTMVRVWGTIEGSEPWGAAGWAGIFTVAALTTGSGYAWIGDV